MLKALSGRRVVIAILICALYLSYRFYEGRLHAATLRTATLEAAVPTVAIIHAKTSAPNETITLPGNITAWFEAPVYAQVSGYVKMWYKDYGANVKKGETLAEIYQPTIDAQFEQAKADLASERARYGLAELSAKRWAALRLNHAVSEQSIAVQEAEAKAQAAKVHASEQHVKNQEALVRFKTIVAPFDGVVTDRNINVGDFVNKEGTIGVPGAVSNLFSVADVSMMRLFVNVPESFGFFLNAGMTADVTVPQWPDRHLTAKFLTVARGFDVSTRTAVTEFTIDNEDRALWPGSYARVRLTVPVEKNVLTIPSTALVFQEDGAQVAVATDDDIVHFKPITVARILDNAVEVTEGISTSDRIINNPRASLLEGRKVRIVTARPGYDLISTEGPAPEKPSSR